MSYKRTRCGPTRNDIEDWRFDFHEILLMKHITHLAYDRRTHGEDLFGLRIHHEIEVALTVAGISVLETMKLLR